MPDVQLQREAKCDSCGYVWRPTLKVRARVGDGEEWLMHCPRCHRRYDVATITKRGQELRDELDRVRADTTMPPEEREAELVRLEQALRGETTDDVRRLTD